MGDGFLPDRVEEGLWVGRAPRSLEDFAALADLGVRDVLTLQTEAEAGAGGLLPVVAVRAAASLGMALHRVPITDLDASSLRSRLAGAVDALAALRSAGRPVYVHCAAGLNRSPTVVAGWLALSRGLDAFEACLLVQSAHRCFPDAEALRDVLADRARRP